MAQESLNAAKLLFSKALAHPNPLSAHDINYIKSLQKIAVINSVTLLSHLKDVKNINKADKPTYKVCLC